MAAPLTSFPGSWEWEDAMWNCVSCEMWSAYKMKAKHPDSKCAPVSQDEKGELGPKPQVITDKYVDNGEVVYGEFKTVRSSRRQGNG